MIVLSGRLYKKEIIQRGGGNTIFYEDIYFKGIYSYDNLKQSPNTPRQGLMKNIVRSWHHETTMLFSCPVVSNSLRPRGLQHTSPPWPLISWSLPKLMPTVSVLPSSHLILWHPLFLLPSIFPRISDFSSELTVRIRWPKYWSFSFSISSSKE